MKKLFPKRSIRFPLVITYDDKKMQDGFGAQAIRLVGIYSICSYFKVNYLHSPISVIGNRWELTGRDVSEETYVKSMDLVRKITQLSDSLQVKASKQKTIYEHNIGFKKLIWLLLLSLIYRAIGVQLILKLFLPFGIMDRMPRLWEIGALAIRENLSEYQNQGGANLVVHYRTGLNSPSLSRPQLSSLYYKSTLGLMGSTQYIDFDSIIIHTDFHEEDLINQHSSERITDFTDFVDYCDNTFKHVTIGYSSNILDTFSDMFMAENLVVSRSALSYFAGILNSNRVIYPPSHGHSKLPRWIPGFDTPGSLRKFP